MSALIRRVVLRNYKSIAACEVVLSPLTVLVGPNGAGKSNFLDALRFVSDALHMSLEHALRERGGVQNVRRKSRGHPTHFGIRLELSLPDGRAASYGFTIGAEANGGFTVSHEECRVAAEALAPEHAFVAENGVITSSSVDVHAVIERDRLALVALSALPEFRPVYEALSATGFYNLRPERIRELQDADPGKVLSPDGSNCASVLRELGRREEGAVLEAINARLRRIVTGIVGVRPCSFGPKETLEFLQGDDDSPWRFYASNMSDGTLRALGVLVALYQASGHPRPVRVVGIEEPEVAIHPGATKVLAETLVSMSEQLQIVVTSHSPSMVSHGSIATDQLRAVLSDAGQTVIGRISGATRTVLEQRLYTVGELLEKGQLEPTPEPQHPDQLGLF